jgi:group II intron reverse transcriptase/maturase
MKGRTQKILQNSCPQEDRAELEDNVGVQTFIWITETDYTEGQVDIGLLEQIVSPQNLNQAYRQVVGNQGSSGVDKMTVDELKTYLIANKRVLISRVLTGKYRPQPTLRVEIPKGDGKQRKLGIPTVIDRLIQQAINQVLTPLYERQFSSDSYGFRPKRSAHDALRKVQSNANSGYIYGVDMDLEQYFDTVNRSKLIEVLSRTIKDGRVISLIHKFLNSGVQVGDRVEEPEKGVPQGSPLSPLLGNIMLHELDKELTRRGHKFVRYADDLLILCKSRRSAERTLLNTVSFIEGKLYLRVNREKTTVTHISKIKFLGYGFYRKNGGYRFRLHSKSYARMKSRIRSITSRSNGKGDEWRKETLKYYIKGWVNYFKLADLKSMLSKLDEWYRRRLRMVIWKQWKRVKTRFANLQRLGIPRQKAWEHANTRKGYWHTSNSWILSVSITTERLKRSGYIFFSDSYKNGCTPLH